MKIDKLGKQLPTGAAGDAAARTQTKGSKSNAPSSAQPASSTNVTLGSTASQLNSLESSMHTTPVVDANRVAEIKQAISDGRFQVNSGVVADRLIKSVRDLIASGN